MIDTDKYEETDHPELVEFEGETLGDTLTNLLTEVKRLQKMEAFVNWVKNTHPHYYHSLMTAWGGKRE